MSNFDKQLVNRQKQPWIRKSQLMGIANKEKKNQEQRNVEAEKKNEINLFIRGEHWVVSVYWLTTQNSPKIYWAVSVLD